MRGIRVSSVGFSIATGSPAASASLTAHNRSRRTRGLRPAPEICGAQDRSSNRRWGVPCIHENALLLVDGLENGRAEDAAGLADGDQQGRRRPRGETRIHARAAVGAQFGFVAVCTGEKQRARAGRGS
jgi:hypothetical protein